MAKKKSITPKKACKHLKLDSSLKVPICTLEPIICDNWFCESKGFRAGGISCNLNCFRTCAIKNPESSKLEDAIDIHRKTIESVEKRLDHYKTTIPEKELIGGLLAFREEKVLAAFHSRPGAFTDVFGLLDLIPSDISFLNERDINVSRQTNHFINLLSHRNVFSMRLNQILNGDMLVYCTPEGQRELEQDIKDPDSSRYTKLAQEGITAYLEDAKKRECHSIMRFTTLQNYDVLAWCRANSFQQGILDFNHTKKLKSISRHFENIPTKGIIDARECYNLSYRPYMNAVYALRNIYSHSRRFLRIAKKYKDIWPQYEKHIHWLPIWDNTMISFAEKDHKKQYVMKKTNIEDCNEYPMHVGSSTFFPSLMMWTFVGKNWDDICSTRWTKGPIFEKRVETELNGRGVNVLHKNLQLTPDDEIDFICEKNKKYYVVEAKNYGPNWDYTYLSSPRYEGRLEELNEKLPLTSRRLALIDAQKEKLGIPLKAKLQGVIITSYVEPHINIPSGFVCVSVDRMSKVFGKKRDIPFWERDPILRIPENILQKSHRRIGLKH